MRSLIISDVHEESPMPAIERARAAGIERVIFLGDVEHPRIWREIYELKNRIFVLGNHEYSYCDGSIPVSGEIEDQEEYFKSWLKSPEEKRRCQEMFAEKGLANFKDEGCVVRKEISGRKCCFLHGLLAGGVYFDHPFIGGRLLGDHEHKIKKLNFIRMTEEGIDILFRGHDHKDFVYSALNEDINNQNFNVAEECSGLWSTATFREGKRYIVSVGSLKEGHCAILDEDKLQIDFCSREYLK